MLEFNKKTSILIPSQLPEYIRDNPEYSNFVAFIQAYYEWMEQQTSYGVTFNSKNLMNYADIDNTTDQFLEYFVNDFLPYFPDDALLDKRKAVKIARQLYESKGTPASYQFLFRLLYNCDFDYFNTKDIVLRASAGNWYQPRSLKLASTDTNFLEIDNYRLFGETSKSIATVEKTVLAGNKIEIFISNIQRLFQSGEFVRVVDNNNQTALFSGQPLRAKIVGQISQIKINPNYRGLLYESGNPVVVYGGLNSTTGVGAKAEVGQTTSGSIQRITVQSGGYGYREDPNTVINITNLGTGAQQPIAVIETLDPDAAKSANVVLVPKDSISLKQFITIGNTSYNFANNMTANANTTLANAFTFVSFTTRPISSISVKNGGGGIKLTPQISAQTFYTTDNPTYTGDLKSLGILAPIQISNPGKGYQANDKIVVTGGTGVGAYANVKTVAANGAILTVEYVKGDLYLPLGGMGYTPDGLPTLSVQSANVNASNASLYVPGILSDGGQFKAEVDRVGAITTIDILEFGEDYISAPNVSLKVHDIVVSNVSLDLLPQKLDIVYQGANTNSASYFAYVDSIELLSADADPTKSLYNLRLFNYTTKPLSALTLKVDNKNINMQMLSYPYNSNYDSTGVRSYGDGTARATATFLNGLTIGAGSYLNSQGHPSSYDLLQSEDYNNFTYKITVEKEISKYKEILLNLLHPAGMKVIGRNALKANSNFDLHALEGVNQGYPLAFYTGYAGSNVSITADFTNPSNNIVVFSDLAGANIATFISTNNFIRIYTASDTTLYVKSEVVSVNGTSNTVTLKDNVWLTYANVANITANAGSNTIKVLSLTNSYNIINNGIYSNTAYPLMDIVKSGNLIKIANNTTKTVDYVDYINNRIYLTTNLANNSTSLMSINKTIASTDVYIYGPLGQQYTPQLTTEDGYILTTENDEIIILG